MAERVCLRITPIKTISTIKKTGTHNTRKEGNKTGSHIDLDKIKDNEVLFGSSENELWKDVAGTIRAHEYNPDEWMEVSEELRKADLRLADGGKIRKDAVLCAEVEMHYPGEMKLNEDGSQIPVDEEKFEKWKELTVAFLMARFNEGYEQVDYGNIDAEKVKENNKNIKSIILHNDESTPHIHCVTTAMYQDKNNRERMSYHHFVGGKKDCAELQTQYAKAVESLGFERGVALTGHQNTSLKQARNYLTKDVGAELPLPNPGETLEQYRERANEEYAAVSVQRSALELKNLDLTDKYEKSGLKDKKIKELEERIEREREKVLAAERERDQMEQKMKSELQRRMCELEGMRNHQDPGMIKEIYVPLQESLVADGMEIFRKNGFILDRNGDGIDDRDQTIDENGNIEAI